MNRFQVGIYESLINLRNHLDKGQKPERRTSRGICSIVYYDLARTILDESGRQDYLIAIQEFKQLCAKWPDGTMISAYPVPADGSKNPDQACLAFHNTDSNHFWLTGLYAKRRYDLICYLILRYKEM
jgi:hypothetical protein